MKDLPRQVRGQAQKELVKLFDRLAHSFPASAGQLKERTPGGVPDESRPAGAGGEQSA